MAKSYRYKNKHNRRKQDKQMTMTITPTWVDKLMSSFRYVIYLTPICCCIIATWTGDDRWMMTAVHTLALSLLIQLTEK